MHARLRWGATTALALLLTGTALSPLVRTQTLAPVAPQTLRDSDVPRNRVREIHAAERPRRDPVGRSPAAARGREPLVPRRPGQRGSRAAPASRTCSST